MSPSTAADRASPDQPSPDETSSEARTDQVGAAGKVLGELRRTAPETRAVLAGLLLVLGAWVGPGQQREVAGGEEAEIATAEETVVRPEVGGEAYAAAVQGAAASRSEEDARPVLADED